MLGVPLPGIQLGNFPISGFPWLIARFRGFIFSGFPFGDFTLFGISIQGFPPFRVFNSEIPAFSGFQFGDFRLFGFSIWRSPPFRGFNSGISAFSGFRFGDFRLLRLHFGDFRFPLRGSPLGKFFLSVLGVLRTFRLISGFFSGKWVHFRVFFRAVGSISGLLFGQSGPFRAIGSISGVFFRASGSISGPLFGRLGPFRFFWGAIGSILGISLGRLGPFFCFFKSLVPFRGFCSGNACSILGDVSCNWVEFGEPFGSCSNNSVQSFFCLSNSYKTQNAGIFGEDFLRIMVGSGLPLSAFLVLAMALILFLQILVQVHGNGYLANRPPQPPVGPASPPHSVGSQAPPQKAPKTWKIFQGIFSVKLNLWFPSKQFGTPQEICAKNV